MKGMREDKQALTMSQFNEIMQEIKEKHSFGKYGHTNWVKYIRPSFDMRDGKCFQIVLDERVFDTNDCDTTMFEEIKLWLNRKPLEAL